MAVAVAIPAVSHTVGSCAIDTSPAAIEGRKHLKGLRAQIQNSGAIKSCHLHLGIYLVLLVLLTQAD
jgi:hypothetical protein